ncbi:MAG: hypothetical protein AAF206_15015 [Bacteroidota bacterium]
MKSNCQKLSKDFSSLSVEQLIQEEQKNEKARNIWLLSIILTALIFGTLGGFKPEIYSFIAIPISFVSPFILSQKSLQKIRTELERR